MASTKNNNRNTRTDTEKHNEKIMDKIREKENEKAKLGGFKASLRNCKNEIEATNRRYWRKKTYVNNYPIAREGVIRNKFEGNAAEAIRDKNAQFANGIEPKVSKAENIAEQINRQENRLQNRMSEIDREIGKLREDMW